ncbi:fibronectin type III domain-containing protein [Hymenobacter negativus]|uniref:Fibronectin type III domain-containing protein n=1 Tax=Hymenobacter negativus TaxID=2795026 RepID=A0ABS0QBG7_9BACT|nr:fibronectin type III domain-containing protein [Hymenobacter negativus]MBH8559965.1 fibronectin type III domain-containing protein [Hymenobacter negativus]
MTKPIRSIPKLKRWALLLGGLLGASFAQGQALNYTTTSAANVSGTFTDLGSAGTAISTANTDDANSTAQNIGFTFSFNGASFTQFVLNTNGLIRLGNATPSAANIFLTGETGQATGIDPISSTSTADVNLVMPFNFDLTAGTGTPEYRVSTSGTAPNQVCTIQWKNVSDKSGTSRLSQYANFAFQVKLYQTSNRIEFVYGTATPSTNTAISRFPTVGIKGSGAGNGQTVLASKSTGAAAWSTTTFITGAYTSSTHNFNSTALPDAGRTYRFDTGTPVTPTGPANDDCAGAITLTPAATCTPTTGTTVGATQSQAPIVCGSYTGNSDDDVWYRFVATATSHTVTVVGSASFDAVVDVRSGTCASSTNIGCADATTAGGTETATLTGLTVGSTYYVRVYSYDTAMDTFTICVTLPVAGPANDNPTGAIALAVGSTCTPTNGTNAGATTTTANGYANPGTCGIAVNPKDVWYSFTTLAGQTAATVTVTGNPAGLVRVFSATSNAGPFTQVSCSAGTANNTVAGPVALAGLTPNTTYYISVAGYGSADTQGAFTICVTNGSTATTCAGVTNVATANPTSTAAASAVNITFTPAAGATDYTVTLNTTGGTGTPASGNITGSPLPLTGLTPNTSYTITITTNCSNGGTSSPVTFVFTSPAASTATPPANDNCSGAIALTSGTTCTPTTGTTVGATQSQAPIACGGYTGNSDDDVWYSFVASATSHTVTVTGNGTFDAVVDVRSGTCASSTNIGCADATTAGGIETATLTGLTVGSTYYVRVYSYDAGTTGTFTICVTGGSGGGTTCAGVTGATVTNNGGTATTASAILTFTAAAGATNYTLTLNTTAGGGTPTTGTLAGSPINLTGLTPNTSYTVTIVTNCANGGTSTPVTVVFTSGAAVPPPANDNPTGAIALTVSSTCAPTNGTNAGATTTTANGYANPGTCGIATAPKDVWYSFTTLAGQTAATVTVTGNPAGLVRVFSAASNAGPFTQVSCSAGNTNNTVAGPVSLTGLTGNTTYYISVAGYGSNDTQGAFTICVTGTAPCLAPAALAAGSITTTGATLTFTPATGAGSYTVTYTPTGGTAQTQTATGSPVVLTGLASGTAYTVSVVTNCGGGQTSTAATTTFTTLTPCTAVTSLATSNVTTTSATLTFTGASAGTSYTVTYTPAGGTAQTQTATGSPVTLANLTPGTAYTVSVVTNCGSQVSPSASATFTTLTPCVAVTGLTAGSISTTGATLTFTAPTAGATGYVVTYTPTGGTAQTQTATGSPVVLTGLASGTTYTVSVVTSCGGGQTSAATTTTFTTLAPCTAVTGLTAGSITATGATLTFTGASAGTSYTVTYTPAGGTAQTQTATGSPVTLTGLQAGKQYSVSVVTNCGGGQTSTAATTTFTTLAPAPTSAVVSGITSTGATIAFTAATGATNYTVTYTRAGGTAQTVTVTGSPVVLTGLAPGGSYTITIVANYPGGGTSSPLTVTFNTVLAARTALGGGELAVYPNPARQSFTVSLPALGAARTAQVELVSVLGQTISRQTVGLTAGGTRVPFDATGLPTGVYAVRVQVNGETAVIRLVLE